MHVVHVSLSSVRENLFELIASVAEFTFQCQCLLVSIVLVVIVSFLVMILNYNSSVLLSFHVVCYDVLAIVVHLVLLQFLSVFVTTYRYLLVL